MPASPIRQHYPSQHCVSSDRRLGDRRPSQTVARLGADASLPHEPHSSGTPKPKTTKSGHHLSAYKRTHYGARYPEGGGRGPGGPRHGDEEASVCSSRSTMSAGGAKDPKTQSSPKHGFSRTHDGGFWGYSRPSSVCSTRSDISGTSSAGRSSHRRFPRNKTELNIREDEMDRIKGYSRKPNGGYWKDREHLDPVRARPHSARAHRWEPTSEKLWTPRAAYVRKKLGEFYKAEHEGFDHMHSGGTVQHESEAQPTYEIFESKAADPTKPKPGYTRTYWGSYYRDPDKALEMSPRRTPQSSVPPVSGYTRTPLGGFFRGKTYEGPDQGDIDAEKHFRSLPVSANRQADPAAPGPGYTRTNYGGFYQQEKQYAE